MVNLYDPAAVKQKGYDVGHKRGSKVAKLRSRGAAIRASAAENRAIAELQKNLTMLERRGFGTARQYAEGFGNGWENATGDQLNEAQAAEEEAEADRGRMHPTGPDRGDIPGFEKHLGVLLDEVLEGQIRDVDAPALFVNRIRADAVRLQAEDVSVEHLMRGVFVNTRQNPETHGHSDDALSQVVASAFAQLIREGSLHR